MKMRPFCAKNSQARGRILATSTVIALLLHGLALAGMPWLLPCSEPQSTAAQGITLEIATAPAPTPTAVPVPDMPALSKGDPSSPKAQPAPPDVRPLKEQKHPTRSRLQRSAPAIKSSSPGRDTAQRAPKSQNAVSLPSARYDNPRPVYPELARKRGQEGIVRLLVHVDEQGRVTDVHVARSSGWAMLDAAALKSVRRWHFQPAMRADVAVKGTVMIPVRFSLR